MSETAKDRFVWLVALYFGSEVVLVTDHPEAVHNHLPQSDFDLNVHQDRAGVIRAACRKQLDREAKS